MQRVAVSVGVIAQHAGCRDGQRHAGMGAVVVVVRHWRRVGDVNHHGALGAGEAVARQVGVAGVAAEAGRGREGQCAARQLRKDALQAGGVDAEHRQRVAISVDIVAQHAGRCDGEHRAGMHAVVVSTGHRCAVEHVNRHGAAGVAAVAVGQVDHKTGRPDKPGSGREVE